MDDIIELSNMIIELEFFIPQLCAAATSGIDGSDILLGYFKDFSKLSINDCQAVLENSLPLEDSQIRANWIHKFEQMHTFYLKFGIKSIDEIIDKIIELWKVFPTNNTRFIANVIYSFHGYAQSKENLDKFMSISLKSIYVDMYYKNMLKPNLIIGSSDEPLYAILPVDPDLFEINLCIISNPTIDWSIYSNGMSVLDRFCYAYERSVQEGNQQLKKYYHDAIMCAIKSSCNLFQDSFSSPSEGIKPDHDPLYFRLMGTSRQYCHKLDAAFKKEIIEYLLSDEGFIKQTSTYSFNNSRSNKVIEALRKSRSKRQNI